MDKVKEYWGRLSKKVQMLVIAGAVAVVAISVIAGLALNNKTYGVLFTEVSSTEAQQIIGKLQEDQTPYQYQGSDILVPEDVLDVTKAKLVSEGYPQSGFTYDVYRNNIGMMTTESDRQKVILYELETRIGATIQLFEGVKEAYVTIALAEDSKYALDDGEGEKSSAQAVVVMKDGGSPSPEVAKSIQLLISRSIPGLVIENVSVFDGNGLEVSQNASDSTFQAGREGEEIAQIVEGQITAKVLNVLAPVYGSGNVRVSAKAKINMERLMRESITYNTPDKIDEQDKTGIISEESLFSEYSGNGATAAGVAGAESNADIPQYNAGAGDNNEEAYGSNSQTRQYVIDQIKEQGQIDPGALEDLTISVVINNKDKGFGDLTLPQLQQLIGNAAGMAEEARDTKIAVAAVEFYTIEVPQEEEDPVKKVGSDDFTIVRYLPYIIIAGALLLILLVLLIVLFIRRRKKKKAMASSEPPAVFRTREAPKPAEPEAGEEMLEFDNDRGMELRKNVRDFAEQNPEISAQLLKTWLNGGDKYE